MVTKILTRNLTPARIREGKGLKQRTKKLITGRRHFG
jgi:hypothetical protein